jgi:preprotein translocase subunit SecG
MAFIIGLLTFVLVLNCLVLIFLVLIQLPKKEAGAGLAFGGAATDALFGAGSGTVLTKITKYSATMFFVLAILLAIMQRNYSSRRGTQFERLLAQPGKAPSSAVLPPSTTTNSAQASTNASPVLTNLPLTTPAASATNAAPANTNTAPLAEQPK